MNHCTLSMNNNQDSFIRVYNLSDFIVKVGGFFYIGQSAHPFLGLNCFPEHMTQISFPSNANLVNFIVEMWIITEARWSVFANVSKALPGEYCFKTTGTIISPSFTEIPCPNDLTC